MNKLEKGIYELNRMEQTSEQSSPLHKLDARAKLLVTLLFLFFVLSLSLNDLAGLILCLIYPIVSCTMAGISYGVVFKRSLIVLPFIVFIGIFNPILDKQVVFYVNGIGITAGWISFLSIIIRGLISVQAVFILILTTGFYNVCRGLGRLGIPSLLTTQLLFVYRYISVLMQEALSMDRARAARSFGRKSYPFKMWGVFIGQLLIRTIDRSERIHRAMLARGFTGNIEGNSHSVWRTKETLFVVLWICLFLLLKIYHPTELFNVFTNS
ncbi:cobalt ECF transporter T component CbiQ [Bacteroides sp.]|uniref:cobalt ECF transporter T component CbiQ n=1 Tax=Bacteroides sp. TaxID=29523 RepID=UPI0026107D7E|nr:cobalt ECF transporter T component CbiQ [Bacteroides sp.]MDD3037562.1 cobalt ECF transporter T component CbiQ [Bacteroides sp.]